MSVGRAMSSGRIGLERLLSAASVRLTDVVNDISEKNQ